MLNRTEAPQIVDPINFNLQLMPYEKYVLKNGIEVYSIQAGTENVMMLDLVFDAGNWYETKNSQAALTNFLLKNGTNNQSALAINEHVEYYGAYLNRSCYSETATITLHTLTKHFERLIPTLKDIATNAIFPQEEIDIAVQNMKQKLQINLKKSSFVAGRIIDTYLFGEQHPYGRFSKAADFDLVTREDLVHFYNEHYKKGKVVIFAAGKLPKNLNNILDEYFGDVSNNSLVPPTHIITPSKDKKHVIVNDENSSQGSIRIARPFINRHHPDFIKAQVLNILFGGFFGSRLMTNIREEKGYTYGIHSHLMSNRYDNGWMITTEAGKQVSEATIAEVYKEMDLLRNEEVDEEELLLVKNFMIGNILGDLDGPFHVLGRWKNIVLNQLGNDYFNKSIATIKAVTAKELQLLAQQYLRPEDFYELVVY